MAYVIPPPPTDVYYVDDSLLAAYQAAGWTQATAGQIAAWQGKDVYGGQQAVPPAPPLLGTGSAPPASAPIDEP